MAKELSVAPKERINIKYKPATGDAQEEVELPLKLLMMGDYTLRNDDTALEDRKSINIDKDNFDEVMKSQELKVDIAVPNRLSEEEEGEMATSLTFDTLKDFTPEAIAGQVPELKTLMDLRNALVALKGPLGNVPAFRKKIQQMLGDDAARQKLLDELGIGKEGESKGE
jgi:type VI secretion system protein ImpB